MRWTQITCSLAGDRASNEDSVWTHSFRRGSLYIGVVCDGVGGRPAGADCAKAVGEAILLCTIRYLENRSAGRLNRSDVESLKRKFFRVRIRKIPEIPEESATTLAIAIFEGRSRKSEYRSIVLWSGDTRVSMLESSGQLRQITRDHHDSEGRLTSYVDGKGRFKGQLEGVFTSSPMPCALSITTDGIHERCTPSEWARFLLYCAEHRIRSSSRLARDLTTFLGENVSDNYSAAILHRTVHEDEARSMLGNLEESDGDLAGR